MHWMVHHSTFKITLRLLEGITYLLNFIPSKVPVRSDWLLQPEIIFQYCRPFSNVFFVVRMESEKASYHCSPYILHLCQVLDRYSSLSDFFCPFCMKSLHEFLQLLDVRLFPQTGGPCMFPVAVTILLCPFGRRQILPSSSWRLFCRALFFDISCDCLRRSCRRRHVNLHR